MGSFTDSYSFLRVPRSTSIWSIRHRQELCFTVKSNERHRSRYLSKVREALKDWMDG